MPVINNELKKYNEKDNYPIIDQSNIRGGLHFVENLADLKDIPAFCQKRGLHVFVGDTGATYINEGAFNAWIKKTELTTVNGKAADKNGNLDLHEFDYIRSEKIILQNIGLNYENNSGDQVEMISAGFGGDGIMIGHHDSDSAVCVKDNLRIIQSIGEQYEIVAEHNPRQGKESEVFNTEFMVSWNFAFESSCVIDYIKFKTSFSSEKSIVYIYDAAKKIIGQSTSLVDYKESNPNPIDKGFENLIELDLPAYVINGQPITISIVTPSKIDIGYGHSDVYGYETAAATYAVRTIINGAVETSRSSIKGSMITPQKFISPDGITLIEESSKPIDLKLFEADLENEPSEVHGFVIDTTKHENFKNMTIHSLFFGAQNLKTITGVQARAVVIDKNGISKTVRFTTIKPTRLLENESYTLSFNIPITLDYGQKLDVRVYSLDSKKFSLPTDNNKNIAVTLVGNETITSRINYRTLVKPVKYTALRRGEERILEITNSDETTEEIDVSLWFE